MTDSDASDFEVGFEQLRQAITQSIHGARGIEGEIMQSVDGRFTQRFAHRCSLKELRQMPRYLCDSILSSQLPVSVVTWDHYSYWAWTATVASALHPQGMVYSMIADDSDPADRETPISDYFPIISDFFTMKHLVLFPVRQSQLDNRVRAFVSSMNPNVDGVEDSAVLGFAGTNGLSILDGLLTQHCDHLTKDEQLVGREDIDGSWRDDGGIKSNPNLRGKLWLWRESNENIAEDVKQTLTEIDDMSRTHYDINHLSSRIKTFDRSDWHELPEDGQRRESFFWILTQQRHQNIHGLHTTQVIGPLVMNLCALVIWDILDRETYRSIRENLFKGHINPQGMNHRRMMDKTFETPFDETVLPGNTPFGPDRNHPEPDMFYPVFPDEEEDLMDYQDEVLGG
jgi:hypothetical protein